MYRQSKYEYEPLPFTVWKQFGNTDMSAYENTTCHHTAFLVVIINPYHIGQVLFSYNGLVKTAFASQKPHKIHVFGLPMPATDFQMAYQYRRERFSISPLSRTLLRYGAFLYLLSPLAYGAQVFESHFRYWPSLQASICLSEFKAYILFSKNRTSQ